MNEKVKQITSTNLQRHVGDTLHQVIAHGITFHITSNNRETAALLHIERYNELLEIEAEAQVARGMKRMVAHQIRASGT